MDPYDAENSKSEQFDASEIRTSLYCGMIIILHTYDVQVVSNITSIHIKIGLFGRASVSTYVEIVSENTNATRSPSSINF